MQDAVAINLHVITSGNLFTLVNQSLRCQGETLFKLNCQAISSGVVEWERRFPKYFYGETPLPQMTSGQGGTVIQ